MCSPDDQLSGSDPRSVAEALRAARRSADYLNSAAAGELDTAALGDVLRSLGELRSMLTAAPRPGWPR